MRLWPQDVLFGILVVTVIALMTRHMAVIVVALVGAFGCGTASMMAAMLPSRDESLLHRTFVSAFLALVMSSLVLIVPGTLGAAHPAWGKAAIDIAVALPLLAIAFEVARTPRVLRGILWCLGQR
jgi:hypothetical protein